MNIPLKKIKSLDRRYSEILAEAVNESSLSLEEGEVLWDVMREEAESKAGEEPILGSYFHATILNHDSFGSALSFRLASKLDNPMLPTMLIRDVIKEAIEDDTAILKSAEIDMLATCSRDPACRDLTTPFLFFKGYHALQAHRVPQHTPLRPLLPQVDPPAPRRP